jgi:N-acetylgalactosamine-6-sulfatase
MPWIVRWPGHVPAGRVDDSTVMGAVDFLPSVCCMAGADVPADLAPDGEDMSAALLGKRNERTKPLMWEWRFPVHGHTLNKSPMLSIRDGKWKLLMNPDRSRVELYDIPGDPSELSNVAKKHPDIVKRLSKQVLTWQATLPEGPVLPNAGSNAYRWPK